MHHSLPNNKRSFLNGVRSFLRGQCFCVRNFISALTKDMCFSKEELEEISKRVKNTKQGEEKFREWERVAPAVKEGIQTLKDEIDALRGLNKLYANGIIELYLADKNNDTQTKADIFARFGLPHILK